MRKKIEQLEQRLSMLLVEELITRPEAIGPVNYIARRVDVPGPEVLKKVCHDLKEKIKNHLAVLVASIDGKTYVAVGIAEELVKSHQLDAGKIIKEHVAPLIKGGGGGQKILATAGGQDSSRIEDIFQVVKKLL
jgi:alanyl-tRNA synthetase